MRLHTRSGMADQTRRFISIGQLIAGMSIRLNTMAASSSTRALHYVVEPR